MINCNNLYAETKLLHSVMLVGTIVSNYKTLKHHSRGT